MPPTLGGARSSLHFLLALSSVVKNDVWDYLSNGFLLPQTACGRGWRLFYSLESPVSAQYVSLKTAVLRYSSHVLQIIRLYNSVVFSIIYRVVQSVPVNFRTLPSLQKETNALWVSALCSLSPSALSNH